MRKQHIPYAVVVTLVLLTLTVFPKWTVDDAYISFRYAENLVRHGEFTFNVGEDPVEGYTGVLLPLGIALALIIGIPPEPVSHLFGILSLFVALIAFYNILTRLCSPPSVRFSILFLFATAPFLYTHVFSGLETLPFTALLLTCSLQLHSLVNLRSASFLRHAAIALSLLALSLCRPEGAAYAAIVICVLSGTAALHITSRRPLIISFLFLLIFPGALYFIWRWQYYGYLLPNTFYAKQAASLSGSSLRDLVLFCRKYLFLPTLGVAATWISSLDETITHIHRKRQFLKRADLLTLGSLVSFSLVIVAQYLRSDLVMNFSYRFYTPLYPIALLFLGWILPPSFETTQLNSSTRPWTHATILLGLCVMLLAQMAYHTRLLFRTEIPLALGYKTRLSEMHRAAGLYLKHRVPDSEWLIVHVDAGAIPFYSGLKTVDFGHLNDKYLAHNKSASIEDRMNYFFSKKPGAVVFTTYEWNRVNHGHEATAIISDPRFEDYALVRKFGNTTGLKYYEFVFLRRDLLQQGEEIDIAQQPTAGDDVPAAPEP